MFIPPSILSRRHSPLLLCLLIGHLSPKPVVEPDASDYTVARSYLILLQMENPSSCIHSWSPHSAELSYDTHDKEFLAIIPNLAVLSWSISSPAITSAGPDSFVISIWLSVSFLESLDPNPDYLAHHLGSLSLRGR